MIRRNIRSIFSFVFSLTIVVMVWSAIPEVAAQTVPPTTMPMGFGRYCSVTYPDGKWDVLNYAPSSSDPCIKFPRPGGTVRRAGYWSVSKSNNILRTCDGDVGIYRGVGKAQIDIASNEGANKKNCIFTIAPTELKVFGSPYALLPGESHAEPNVFDFDVYDKPLKSTDFGQPAVTCPNGTGKFIDRTGRQLCSNWEQAYDWSLKKGTPITSVAPGIVRAKRFRDVSMFANCGTDGQGEVYIEHRVGNGDYAERFVTYYAHMEDINVKVGDVVMRGDTIGTAGATGCVNPPTAVHLHFAVFRTTNLSGHRTWNLTFPEVDRGVSSIQGVIDPFGWNAPKHIDPWAWAFLGTQSDPYEGTVTNPGAFSIYLWRDGQAPRTHD